MIDFVFRNRLLGGARLLPIGDLALAENAHHFRCINVNTEPALELRSSWEQTDSCGALASQDQTFCVRHPYGSGCLRLMYHKVNHPWTIANLAGDVAMSRSALSERFTRCLSEPPMTYLTRWRMQLAA